MYGLFRRWQRGGVWLVIVKLLQVFADATGRIRWQVSVDSTIMRAHQHAAGARRDSARQAEPPGGCGESEPADHGLGRSRGGWTTKLHLACEPCCRVLAMLVTAGQAGDSPQFTTVLNLIEVAKAAGGRPRVRPDHVLADKAYSSRANREWLRRHGIKATIPVPADQAAHRRNRGAPVGAHRRSTRCVIATATRSSVASTSSNNTALWPPGSTSSPSATSPHSTSPPSTNGYDTSEGRPPARPHSTSTQTLAALCSPVRLR